MVSVPLSGDLGCRRGYNLSWQAEITILSMDRIRAIVEIEVAMRDNCWFLQRFRDILVYLVCAKL